MEDNIKILEKMIENANIEDADMNNCFGGEHIEAIENLIKEFKKTKIENIEYKLGQTPDTTEDYKTLKKELEKWKKI